MESSRVTSKGKSIWRRSQQLFSRKPPKVESQGSIGEEYSDVPSRGRPHPPTLKSRGLVREESSDAPSPRPSSPTLEELASPSEEYSGTPQYNEDPFSNMEGRSIDPDWIDITMIGQWLRKCDKDHGIDCCKPLGVDTSTLPRPALLIDVRKKCLTVASASHVYACLSYVWGGAPTLKVIQEKISDLMEEGSLDRNRDEIPRTIKDCIGFVEQLGINYLWVDALCIIQDDKESKHAQIQAMAGIYSNAYVTIIAGNGWDANHGIRGIPGVTEARQLSAYAKLDLEETIQPYSSIWYSRGWCFQEMVLSPRKIMFQYQCAIWECSKASWHEVSLPKIQTSSGPIHLATSVSPWTSYGNLTKLPDIRQYVDMVHAYATRKLTYPEDGLPAITGLLSLLNSSFSGRFITGLPEMFFDETLLWQPGEHMQRRQAATFADSPPSWSWVGWEGEIMVKEWLFHFSHLGIRRSISESTETPKRPILQVTPVVTWYYGNNLEERTKVIRSGQTYIEHISGKMLPQRPTGWEKSTSDEYYYKGDPNTRSPYPLPIAPEPPLLPVSARYLFGRTTRGRFKKDRKYHVWSALNMPYPSTAFTDRNGNVIGSLNLNLDHIDDPHDDYFELVAISAGELIDCFSTTSRQYGLGYDYARLGLESKGLERFPRSILSWGYFERGDGVTNRYTDFDSVNGAIPEGEKLDIKFYYVLWIGWENGVAYRKALGRVLKEAWDTEATEEIDLVLG